MYDKSIVKLIIGKVETSLEFKVGVKQVYSIAPVLFLFLTMAFYKTLEDEWTALAKPNLRAKTTHQDQPDN